MSKSSFVKKCADAPLFRHFPRMTGGVVGLFGLLIIVSWHAHWRPILQMLPDSSPMQYNTALCFILSGSGLFLLTTTRAKIAPWLGGAAAFFSLLTLLQYVTGRDFSIDLIFFKPYFEVDRIYRGRMSPLAAVCFIFIGAGIVLAGAKKQWLHRLAAAGLLACIVAVIAGVALFGYIFGIEAAYGWGAYARIAINTAVTFLLLSSGLLIWSWQTARREHFNFLRWLPVAGSVTLMAMIAFVSAVSLVQLKNALFWRGHTYQVLLAAGSIVGSLADTQRGMRGYVLTTSPEALELYRGATNKAPRQLAQLAEMTRDNPIQRQHLDVLAEDIDAVIAYSRQLIDARAGQGLSSAVQLEKTGRGLAVMNQVRADLDTFTEEEQWLLIQRDAATASNYNNIAKLLVFGSVMAAGLLVLANFSASREVKRRRQSEEIQRDLNVQLAKSLMLQNAILSSANYAIITGTVGGVVTTFNSTSERWLGYKADEIVGKKTPALWHDAGEVISRAKVLSNELGRTIEPGFESFVAKARLGQADENEWTLIRKDASRFPVSLSVTTLVDATGVITGFLGVIADITERKKKRGGTRKTHRRIAVGIGQSQNSVRPDSNLRLVQKHSIRPGFLAKRRRIRPHSQRCDLLARHVPKLCHKI
jgi:PAS domain S-box-containing protein